MIKDPRERKEGPEIRDYGENQEPTGKMEPTERTGDRATKECKERKETKE